MTAVAVASLTRITTESYSDIAIGKTVNSSSGVPQNGPEWSPLAVDHRGNAPRANLGHSFLAWPPRQTHLRGGWIATDLKRWVWRKVPSNARPLGPQNRLARLGRIVAHHS